MHLVIEFGDVFVGTIKDSNESSSKMRDTCYVLHMFYTCTVHMRRTVFQIMKQMWPNSPELCVSVVGVPKKL